MKFISNVSAGLVSMGLLVAASAQEPMFKVPGSTTTTPAAAQPAAPTPAAPAAPAAVKYTDAQLMEAYGYIFVLETRITNQLQALEFTQAQKDAMLRGVGLALNAKELPYDPQQVQAQLQEFIGKKQEAYLTKLRYANLADGQAFFTKLKENKSVIELPSGLRYEISKAGTGATAKPGQVVTLHFTGTFVNGQTFASSLQPAQQGAPVEPVEILLQPERSLPGMVEGLQKLPVGSKAKLYIPPSLAYGDQGSQAIPPGATLIFEVEILGVKDAPKEAAPAAK